MIYGKIEIIKFATHNVRHKAHDYYYVSLVKWSDKIGFWLLQKMCTHFVLYRLNLFIPFFFWLWCFVSLSTFPHKKKHMLSKGLHSSSNVCEIWLWHDLVYQCFLELIFVVVSHCFFFFVSFDFQIRSFDISKVWPLDFTISIFNSCFENICSFQRFYTKTAKFISSIRFWMSIYWLI